MKLIRIFFTAACLLSQHLYAQEGYKMQPIAIQSRWAKEVSPTNALKEYPRPQMVRSSWTNLNGLWDYAITAKDASTPSAFQGQLLVPYPIESALSGVKKMLLPTQNLWYKRTVNVSSKAAERTLLHFGAVDWQATVFVNGKEVGSHTGGYTEFSFDITDALKAGDNELMVKVYDPSDQGIGPHGKQVLNPQNIYYTPTSGIWQTVWMETVPAASITGLTINPDVDKSVVNITVNSATSSPVELTVEGKTIKGMANKIISVPVKNLKLWSPASPYLYDFTAKLGKDVVKSYFGMRKISVAKDSKGVERIMLNNQPYYNLGTLDQGFWPDGLYTAPTDEALAFDIKAIKAMGFNTIRKHIKVEPARWYYHADKLGMLVWQDMVNPNQGLPEGSKQAFEKQGAEMLQQLHNSPSITTWVLFNEKWGQYDQERLTSWIKQMDPTRIVNGHSGENLYVNDQLRSPSPNAYVNADMTDVHSYPQPMNAIKLEGKAQVCGEFGGIGVFIPDHQWSTDAAWGYVQEKPADLKLKYAGMNKKLEELQKEGMSGSIYTQPFDVETEQNGLMTYDREIVKIPFTELRKIHAALNPVMGTIPEVTATDADLTDPAILYKNAQDEFAAGKTDIGFVKKLIMMASQNGDQAGKVKFTEEYFKALKTPLPEDDMRTVARISQSTKDQGFKFMQDNADAFKKVLGDRMYTILMMNMIFKGDMEPMMKAKASWDEIGNAVMKYGAPGEEMYLRAKTVTFYNEQKWTEFVPAATTYLEKFGAGISEQEKLAFQGAINEHK
ncbi:glycoside hydrolase family 2 [Solitalea longa]|uniref:Glycoside hydrolase family 2 n=1 Tax=Solitalea longa TaxID=2079460 RepID=A0A2S5A6T3_9SPHI|nr:sugar-binding domain-containing protein [Solitalea longa]POY38052.1 glycoside hydrolase family 2 [Solitalea longa]